MHYIKLDTNGDYQTIPPRTDAEIVALGDAFFKHETGEPQTDPLSPPLLKQIGMTLGLAREALDAAELKAVKTREAGTGLRAALTEAAPLLDRAIVLLCRKYEANLSVLGEWGLTTTLGARGQVKVARPRSAPQRIDFLIRLTTKENALPVADRLGEIPLARLTELAAIAEQQRTGRQLSASEREQNVAVRSEAARSLYDLLQVAAGLLIVARFQGKVTPALQAWGYNVQPRRTTAAAAAPAAAPGD